MSVNLKKPCIYTCASGEYLYFIPLFIESIKKFILPAYPETDVLILVPKSEAGKVPEKYHKNIATSDLYNSQLERNPQASKIARFHTAPVGYSDILIADVDVLISDSGYKILRRTHRDAESLEIYSNFAKLDKKDNLFYMPAMFWISDPETYFKKVTKPQEIGIGRIFDEFPANTPLADEKHLYKIFLQSRIKISHSPILGYWHGLHLGQFRDQAMMRPPNIHEQSAISGILKNKADTNLGEALKFAENSQIFKKCLKNIFYNN